MPQRILALELDEQELQGVVVETSFRDYRVVGFYREDLAAGETQAEQLRRFVERPELQANTVLSSLPGDVVTWRTFFVPFRDRRRLDQTVPFELEAEVPFGLDEVIVDYHALHRDKSGTVVLAAMVQRADLEKHLSLLAEAGVDPKIVDLAPLAMLNVLRLVEKDLPDEFVYLGGTPQRLTVALYRDKRLAGLRTLVTPPPAEGEMHPGNGKPVGEDDRIESMVGEIRWTLTALNDGQVEAGTVCFVGGKGIQFDAIAQALGSAMDLKTRRIEPRESPRLPRELTKDLPSFASPMGLALREVAPGDAVGVNFRRGEFTYHRAQEEVRRAVGRSAALLAVVFALVVASTYMDYQRLQTRARLLDNSVRDVVAQTLEAARSAPDPVRLLREAIEAEKQKMEVLGDVAPLDGGTVVDALRTVAMALPADIKVDSDEFIMDAASIRMKVTTDSFETADTIKQKIAAANYFADVQVKDVKQSKDGQSVNFRLILTFGRGVEPAAAEAEAAAEAAAAEAPAAVEAPAPAEAPPAAQAPAPAEAAAGPQGQQGQQGQQVQQEQPAQPPAAAEAPR
jgi:type II secretory pathway component PulL